MEEIYWVYTDAIRRRNTLHRSTCPYCNDGKGFHHMVAGRTGGEWNGPFPSRAEALEFAEGVGWPVHPCGHCLSVARTSGVPGP